MKCLRTRLFLFLCHLNNQIPPGTVVTGLNCFLYEDMSLTKDSIKTLGYWQTFSETKVVI